MRWVIISLWWIKFGNASILWAIKPSEDEGLNNSKSPKESRKGKSLTVPTSKLRHVHFLDFNRQSIIYYATRVLIYSLKERVLQPIAKNDLAIGHVVVLLQHCYPQNQGLRCFYIPHLYATCHPY